MEATHLETLTINGKGVFFPYDLARRFSFPSLRSASVKYLSTRPYMALDSAGVTVFIGSALRTVRTLELDFDIGYDLSPVLITGLESCLHLEHLTLHAYGRDADAGVDVITALSKTDTPWLCPRLQTLTLHICPQALGDFGALLNLATKRAASRVSAGQGLTEISVYLKEYVDESGADKHELSLLRQLLNGILSSPSRLPQWPSPYAPRS
ncbi:hypothetical protein EXIGLDRAFT_784079 [Exidia glandulosa HHB12029]|uniref:F-box domain-containing protein n=1 Tax=Exidia glandulosa HHB12029 TaxID=1314781 RepID=A0A166MPY8_EXIGL|nr:hypothetical protein EXIGLDRAFT_784079 [Exidia glandulosa HHB12029]